MEDSILEGSFHLNLPNHFVHFFSEKQGTTCSLHSEILGRVNDFRPTKVFLQIGENDINLNSANVSEVVSGIQNILEVLLEIKSVEIIYIGSLFQRLDTIQPPMFNSLVDKINLRLRKCYSNSTNIIFWNLRGLVKPKKHIWLNDGIHLNKEATRTYLLQIRLAVNCKKPRNSK